MAAPGNLTSFMRALGVEIPAEMAGAGTVALLLHFFRRTSGGGTVAAHLPGAFAEITSAQQDAIISWAEKLHFWQKVIAKNYLEQVSEKDLPKVLAMDPKRIEGMIKAFNPIFGEVKEPSAGPLIGPKTREDQVMSDRLNRWNDWATRNREDRRKRFGR